MSVDCSQSRASSWREGFRQETKANLFRPEGLFEELLYLFREEQALRMEHNLREKPRCHQELCRDFHH